MALLRTVKDEYLIKILVNHGKSVAVFNYNLEFPSSLWNILFFKKLEKDLC